MRTALEIEPKTAEKLRQLADAQKLSVEQLLLVYVPGLAAEPSNKRDSDVEDKSGAFDEWLKDFPADTPPLPDEALDRASIYRDR
jgi:hypothetical protein